MITLSLFDGMSCGQIALNKLRTKIEKYYASEIDNKAIAVTMGLNFKKKGLNNLIKLILNNEVDKLILTHKDRLLRFGSDLLINIAKHFNVETIILNNKIKTFEEELSSVVLEIITVFSAKLYGSRSHKNKKVSNNEGII